MIRNSIAKAVILACCLTVRASGENGITAGTPASVQLTQPDRSGDVWYAVKLPVANKTANFLQVRVELQALDKDGFELATVWLSGTLQPSKSEILTDKTLMSHAQYKPIAKWQVKESSQRVVDKPGVVVSNIATRLQAQPDSSGDVWYAVKADIANHSDRALSGVELQGIDKDGYEVASVILKGNVGPGQRATLSDRTFIKHSDFKRIVQWRHVDR
jgi:hypothetical protein